MGSIVNLLSVACVQGPGPFEQTDPEHPAVHEAAKAARISAHSYEEVESPGHRCLCRKEQWRIQAHRLGMPDSLLQSAS